MDFLEKNKKFIFLGVVVILIITIIITSNYKKPAFIYNAITYVTTPLQKIVVNVEDFVSEKIDNMKSRDEIVLENERLKEENDLLRIQLNRLEMIQNENDKFSLSLDLASKYPELNVTGAKIVGRDSNNWSKAFIIDKGTKHGLKENMVVLAGEGLCGKITKVNYISATVTPIIDDTISVGVQTKRGNDYGFVKGDLKLSEKGLCKMVNIDKNVEILVNDEVVTSNLGDIYPPGIKVGEVTEIIDDPSSLYKIAYIKPAMNLDDVDTVLVVTDIFGEEELEAAEERP